jgi:DNA-binding PadR family transcriptional regulator
MQRLLRDWGKDQVINVGQRANLYTTIKRLHAGGLIAVRQTERDQQYPERTVYEMTNDGRRLVLEWLADMVSTPRNEFPEFPAALSFAMLLGPERTLACLGKRADLLREQLAALENALENHSATLPRVTLLETEYQRAVVAAELGWVKSVLHDLRTGKLAWSQDDFASAAESYIQK